jgi:hypothetical protein
VDPTTGDRFSLEWPYLNAEMFRLFVDAVAQAFPDRLNLLLLDNSGVHTPQRLTLREDVGLVFLPPRGPELNPIERVSRDLRDLKDVLAWRQFSHPDGQQHYIAQLLRAPEVAIPQSLTTHPYLIKAIPALCSS